MPGPVSDRYRGPPITAPYVPSWCYDPPGPRVCSCGHHEGYHGDDGHCNQAAHCGCQRLTLTVGMPQK